jgi:hypothetical protein
MKPDVKPLTCRETTYLVCGARDVPIGEQQRAQLAAHLTTCSTCRIASTQFSQLFAQLDTLLARGELP